MLRDTVYDMLHELLASGGFAADEVLTIDSLAERLNVSPTPVREALVQLESTGLVVRTALRGYRVAPLLSHKELGDLFDARQLLEVGAARMASRRAEELVPRLRECHRKHEIAARHLKDATGADDPPLAEIREYFKADWSFHEAIIGATGNPFIADMAARISTHAQRVRQFLDHRQHDVDHALAEHEAVLSAFGCGDEEAIARALGDHLAGVRARALDAAAR